jgi:hypothetical protein
VNFKHSDLNLTLTQEANHIGCYSTRKS